MESTLSLTLDDLRGEVGFFLGHGRGAALGDPTWTSQQLAAIDSCVKSGLRTFYFPPPLDGMEASYDWSFLKPVGSLALAQGASTIPLPDDFGGLEGPVSLYTTTSQISWPIQVVHEGTVRQRYAELPTASGRPDMAAVQWIKGTTATAGQRAQLLVWPLADGAYTLQVPYYVNPDYLTAAFPYHLGGGQHAETVLESCLAIAEQRLDDAATVHTMKFKERLLASINADRKLKPQTLLYNGDRSDMRDRRWQGRNHYWDQPVTVNGIQY